MVGQVAATLGLGAFGACVGWGAGLMLCPDWGDIGIGAITWAVGGSVIGAAAGVTLGVVLIG